MSRLESRVGNNEQQGEEVSESIAIGTVLAGKYRVERVLGSGGMGMVVAAHHLHLHEKVAIKLQLPSLFQSADSRARFAREARAAVKIKSEYVARVSDVGQLESGAPYMVMEYLEGEDLADMLTRGPLPAEQAVEFVLQACEALAEAHALGIIHRDIKPANLYCVRRTDGLLAIKLLDFGISRAISGTDFALTSSGVMMGSPHYMAPEQMLAAKNADGRSDIWSLGAVLFELLVGEPPFNAETLAALVIEVTTADSAKLAGRLRGVPAGLAQIVLRCLNVEAALRYQSVSELAPALVPFSPPARGQVHADRILRIARTSRHPSLAPPEVVRAEGRDWADGGGKTLMPFGRTSIEGQGSGGRRGRTARVVVGAIGLLVLGAGGWWLAANRRTEIAHETGRAAIVPTSAPYGHDESERVQGVAWDKAPTAPRSPIAQLTEADRTEVALPVAPSSKSGQDRDTSSPTGRVERAKKIRISPAPTRAAVEPDSTAPEPPAAVRRPEPSRTTDPNKPNFGGRL